MKTIKSRLLNIIFIIAVIISTTAIPAEAQRRSSSDRQKSSTARKDNREVKRTVQKKSTFKDYDTRPKSSERNSVNRGVNRDVRQKSPSTAQTKYKSSRSQQKSPERIRNQEPQRREASSRYNNQGKISRNTEKSVRRDVSGLSRENRRETQSKSKSYRDNYPRQRMNERGRTEKSPRIKYDRSGDRSKSNNSSLSRRNSSSRERNFYNLDKYDKRYRTGNNYKGSKKYWSGNYRSSNKHYHNYDKKFYRNYNYRKYHHWNNAWQNYRWNHYSWIDYYNGYHPYSFKFHKYYYHHPVFGHVIKRFMNRPFVFFHSNHRYYCYDGHFFRFHRGIGYILVDIPFGMTFSYLPHDYERVFINGYLYFRVGNLFFERSDYGFRLVHYPERYYAYSDDFYHDGFVFEDMY